MQGAGLWPSIDIAMQRFDIWASIDIAMQGAGVQTLNLNLYWYSYARGPGMSHIDIADSMQRAKVWMGILS